MKIETAVLLILVFSSSACALQTREIAIKSPHLPFEDVGACPFEGCVYREWIATRNTDIYKKRNVSSLVLFHVKEGEWINALDGVVVTRQPGIVLLRKAVELTTISNLKIVIAQPGDQLYLLTYFGEGFWKAWYKNQMVEVLDGTFFMELDGCRNNPDCTGEIVSKWDYVWWIKIKNSRGQVGWTNQDGHFNNKDAYGGERLSSVR